MPRPRSGRDRTANHESPPVGSADVVLNVLADTGTSVQRFVSVFFGVYILLILAYVLTSWIRMPYALHRVQRFLDDICEPYIRLFRRVLPSMGGLDLSPIVAVFTLIVARTILVGLIGRLL
jgi:YggT family protein